MRTPSIRRQLDSDLVTQLAKTHGCVFRAGKIHAYYSILRECGIGFDDSVDLLAESCHSSRSVIYRNLKNANDLIALVSAYHVDDVVLTGKNTQKLFAMLQDAAVFSCKAASPLAVAGSEGGTLAGTNQE